MSGPEGLVRLRWAANREVFACAPTTSAATVLRAEGFSNATTLADFLQNGEAKHGPRLLGATVIVDEAGIASTRQGAELCRLVKAQGARLILVGDSRQHSGVEAGDFLSILENHSLLQTCELTDIRRQTASEYRRAVKLMAQGHARTGLEALDQLGWVKEGGADYVQHAAEHYVESMAAKRDAVLVAPTWEEIHRLTDAVRTGLKARGLLGQSQTVTVAEPLTWTKAQAETVANYRPGHPRVPSAGDELSPDRCRIACPLRSVGRAFDHLRLRESARPAAFRGHIARAGAGTGGRWTSTASVTT